MHCIRAFIGKDEVIKHFESNWVKANAIKLPQGYSMIFLTDEFYDDIIELINSNRGADNSDIFECLSPSICELLQQESRLGRLAYIETEYFGGEGSQVAILFENGKIIVPACKTETHWRQTGNRFLKRPEGESAINIVLKQFGVYKEKNMDEFDSTRLGNYRRMD